MDWETSRFIHQRSITCWGDLRSASAVAATLWPTANKAFYFPVAVRFPFVLKQWFIASSVTSGNFDIGLYSTGGTKLYSSGATAQSGATNLQVVTQTATLLNPGWYYLALAFDNGTAQLFASNPGITILKAMGAAVQTSAYTLPATATFATADVSYVPLFGMRGDASL